MHFSSSLKFLQRSLFIWWKVGRAYWWRQLQGSRLSMQLEVPQVLKPLAHSVEEHPQYASPRVLLCLLSCLGLAVLYSMHSPLAVLYSMHRPLARGTLALCFQVIVLIEFLQISDCIVYFLYLFCEFSSPHGDSLGKEDWFWPVDF